MLCLLPSLFLFHPPIWQSWGPPCFRSSSLFLSGPHIPLSLQTVSLCCPAQRPNKLFFCILPSCNDWFVLFLIYDISLNGHCISLFLQRIPCDSKGGFIKADSNRTKNASRLKDVLYSSLFWNGHRLKNATKVMPNKINAKTQVQWF